MRPFDDPGFMWPTLDEIVRAQEKYIKARPNNFFTKGNTGKGWYLKGRLWIPTAAVNLMQRLMIVAHYGAQGHRGRASMMEQQLQRHFMWIAYEQNGESFGSDKYLLILKDDATHYCELVPCATPTSAVAVDAILDWYRGLGYHQSGLVIKEHILKTNMQTTEVRTKIYGDEQPMDKMAVSNV
ncbi:hypothetical protein PHPALM_30820 [Phytophthora palmivora]|uniref:Integrase zinc-binding domain-containing protein n=1 Tax=Phytophthora palmivora TaxID=4796 RepID=A0A2P4X459_9STRA|nr:hypothetical protein PHPALM_30820 [Phytophthora palmivora]